MAILSCGCMTPHFIFKFVVMWFGVFICPLFLPLIAFVAYLFRHNGLFFILPHRGKAQVACNLLLPHEDNILNKFRILKERHIQMRKPYQVPGWTKNSPYYSASVGDRIHVRS